MSVGPSTFERFVELAGERLSGDWVILGGAVIPLLGGRYRVTLDIDLAGPDDAGAAATNVLLQIAIDLGLPVEAVNQSAAFFLREIPDWREQLDELRVGTSARILVPTATLYVTLKLARLTESDLDDCRARIDLARAAGGDVDRARLLALIAEDDRETSSAPRRVRLAELAAAIGDSND